MDAVSTSAASTHRSGVEEVPVFFLREAENGYCYCFSQPVTAE